MTIIRDGKTYELTMAELAQAYTECQHLNDIDDVLDFAEMCNENYEGQPYITAIEQNPAFVDAVAHRYRDYRNDSDDESWFNDMSYAVMEVGHRLIGEVG